jgi:hypothetical protein
VNFGDLDGHRIQFPRSALLTGQRSSGVWMLNLNECYAKLGRLCGLVVRVPGYRYRGPGFDSRRYQIFSEVVGLKRGPLSLVRIMEELFQGNSGFGLENRD